ncbi:GmrSD restriction endonuclease domain-containing protein [Bradyrhizobium sp. WU425]|uniref:GmrSD restriction endonuclease domain-containing protein n=1 Tax=Bradyrhizobium sp. WU425 TaxID=187029 RepID=UPI001E36EA63|nr:DUF262 domain-containing protein [Bradyrhizobium canariense]UFW75224.1 HNH endonuclease [Bradyrhizobium canariense]
MNAARCLEHYGAEGMATTGVNLDALIPREDLAVGEGMVSGTQGEEKLGITHFQPRSFFSTALRKPEFQRETVHWTPAKIVDLVTAFLDRRLIPAVILWRAGQYNFVVDGAHRLSALLAWIYDDYGDGELSKKLFGPYIAPEQLTLANKTRTLIKDRVGHFSIFQAGVEFPKAVTEEQKSRISNLSVTHFIAQWVPAATKEAAEDSFFKINDAATPLDPTEKRILQSRLSGNAIAARAVAHGGKGYAYWKDFDSDVQAEVARLSGQIYTLLYRPPLQSDGPIDTLDVPVGGRGYSVLPFVFDLINSINAAKVADSTKKTARDKVEKDATGSITVTYLKQVLRTVSRITGKEPASLGLHPVVYFYTKGGAFSPWAFLAWAAMIDDLFERKAVNAFCDVRPLVEKFLIENKWAMTEIIHKNGSGSRSTPWLKRYWEHALNAFAQGLSYEEVEQSALDAFPFLKHKTPVIRLPGEQSAKRISASTRTAAIWDSQLPGAPKCDICHGVWHRNSIQGDHVLAKRDGGDGRPSNTGISHPYCNSTYKDHLAKESGASVSAEPS